MDRRHFASSLLVLASAGPLWAAPRSDAGPAGISRQLAAIEKASGGRLGVSILDTGSGARTGHRVNERFAMCSTFKFLLGAAVLARVDQGRENLERRVVVKASDLITHSPVTEKYLGSPGISVAELCAATVTLSDNAAANLLLATLGGPPGLTAFARALGDPVTRLDRTEPALNQARPGDPRDTTTPAAMVDTMRKLLLGQALSPASRAQLTQWLIDCKTGDTRLRAGFPAGWKMGDKTGTGRTATNDIGIFWPPGRAPILLTAYLLDATGDADARNATLAAVGKVAAAMAA